MDRFGLDEIDQKIMMTVLEKYSGGPVGLNTISASIDEEASTIEEVYEPYLMQLGFLDRTPRGRIATDRAYEYFGIAKPTPQLPGSRVFSSEDLFTCRLGSNVGRSQKHLQAADRRLHSEGFPHHRRYHRLYETAAVEYTRQPDFLNCVVEAETDLLPMRLLQRVATIRAGTGTKADHPKGSA